MFSKLKEKLKGALSVFSKKAEEAAEEKIVEVPKVKSEVPKVEKKVEIKAVKQEVKEVKKSAKAEDKKKEFPAEKIKETRSKEKIEGVKITYFVHGTTTDNEQGKSTGWLPGELSTLGVEQSIDLKKKIKGQHFDAVFCSDLQRAIDSAKLSFDHKIITDQRLRECNYGDLNGAEEEKVVYEEHIDIPFPQGESARDVERRMVEFLHYLYDNYNGKRIAIVAHKAPQLALEVLLRGKTWKLAIKEDWRHSKTWQPGWVYWVKEKIEFKESKEEVAAELKAPLEEPKKGFFSRLFSKNGEVKEEKKGEVKKEKKEEVKEESKEEVENEEQVTPTKEKSFLGKIKESLTTKTISAEKFEDLFWELELALLENNVSVEVIERIKDDLKTELVEHPLPRDVGRKIRDTLKRTLEQILTFEKVDVPARIRKKKPYVIAFFGINGSGKTTTIAKLAHYLQEKK